MASRYTPGRPVKIFYQEVNKGDIRKFNNESNDTPSGGGARDLRISKGYWNELLDFFPMRQSSREQVGKIIVNKDKIEEVSLMAPTSVRPGEIRIATIKKIDFWRITMSDFDAKTAAGFKWFYLLTLDDRGQVWAGTFCSEDLDNMHALIAQDIKKKIAKASRRTIRGIFTYR